MGIFDIINVPLGYLFRFIYLLLNNYGWTLVAFTLITKLILIPLSVKQQKSMSKMQAVQPRVAELQKKYQYDKEKLNQEMAKVYQENGVSPLGGCLPLLIQFPVLIALYNIIRSPLDYVIQLGKHGLPTITEVHEALVSFGSTAAANDQIKIAADMSKYATELAAKFPDANFMFMDFSFFGIDFSMAPSQAITSALILIPILAGLTTFLSSRLTSKTSGQSTQNADGTANSMQMMTYFFPFMTAFIAYSMPAGLGFYWFLSNLFQMGQQLVFNKYLPAKAPEPPAPKHFREREAERRKK